MCALEQVGNCQSRPATVEFNSHVLVFRDSLLLFRHQYYFNCMASKIEIAFRTSARTKIRTLKTDHILLSSVTIELMNFN